MNRLAQILILFVAAAPSCTPQAVQEADPANRAPVEPTPVSATRPANGLLTLFLKVKIISIDVPVGTVSGSEELWSYLDEESVQGFRDGNLGRNGLRVGLARQNTWPDLAKVLTRMTGGKLQITTGVFLPGDPYPLDIKQDEPIQTIFLTNSDRTISGADYPPGDNSVMLSCTLNEDDPSKVMVTGVPEIRTTQRQMRLVNDHGNFSWRAMPTVYSFAPLTFRASIPSKDIVVIGPGSQARRPYSVGNHFLVHSREGVEFEKVLVLIPEVLAQPMK